MVFLGQMRQSYKSGSVRNHEIISLHLGSCAPFSQDPLPPARHQLQLFAPSAQTINQEKKRIQKWDPTSKQIISYCLGLRTQNSGPREVDLEASPERGSDKINLQKQGTDTQKKASCIILPGLIYGSQDLEVDLKPFAKRGCNRTTVLVSLYWLACSLHPKQSPNQISNKSTKVHCIRLPWTWKKSDQIPKSYALEHIKTIFPETTRAFSAQEWGYKWGRHSKR